MTDTLGRPVEVAVLAGIIALVVLTVMLMFSAAGYSIDTGLAGEQMDADNVCAAVHGDGYDYAGSYERINASHVRAYCERGMHGGAHIETVVVTEG